MAPINTIELWASIPRTRASITRYTHGRPVYETTDPYRDKLPAKLMAKSFQEASLADTLAFALAADKPDSDLDAMIWFKAVFDPAIEAGTHERLIGHPTPRYTGSLDHAIKLYDVAPPMIPTDPLDVVCDALRLRLLHG